MLIGGASTANFIVFGFSNDYTVLVPDIVNDSCQFQSYLNFSDSFRGRSSTIILSTIDIRRNGELYNSQRQARVVFTS